MSANAKPKKLGHQFRREKAENLLHYWAYRHFVGRENIEQGAHHTGGNPITSVNPVKNYNPAYGFKMLTNAKQDRPAGKSSIPLGHVMQTETNDRRAEAIDKLLHEKLSPRSLEMTLRMFVPRTAYAQAFEGPLHVRNEKASKLKDRDIAKASGFCPKRASELKHKVIHMVSVEILSPFTE
jgi:hypothetical protein